MEGGLSCDLSSIPGIGPATIDKLMAQGIFTVDQLAGKFMSMDRDCEAMVRWLKANASSGFEIDVVKALAMKLHSLIELQNGSGCTSDRGMLKHKRFGDLRMDSKGRLPQFMMGALQQGTDALYEVPGIGETTVEKLRAREVFTLEQLCGKFMEMDRDCESFLRWFETFLGHNRFGETIVKALAMKLHALLD